MSGNLPQTLSDYGLLEQVMDAKDEVGRAHMMRLLGRSDLYYLLRYILGTRLWKDPEDTTKSFWEKQWLLDRCREVQFDSEGVLNIWARYHAKSTIMTFGFSILNMIQNPNTTIGIFSVTKGVADVFVNQIKFELESNELLQGLYPDRFFAEPRKEARTWTVEKGFTIRRPLNLKDTTVRGFGLTDTSFTGHRILCAIYDDAVNEQSVTTAEMVDKVNTRWELSLNVGMPGSKRYYIGTFYAHGDSYHHMAARGVKLRLYPCYEIVPEKSVYDTESGLPIELVHDREGPVLFSKSHLSKEEKLMGPGTFGVQMLCDPNAGQTLGFRSEWIKRYTRSSEEVRRKCNVIILVDPAGKKKKDSSYTAMWVVGLGDDGNYYLLDMVRDKLNLHERTEALFSLVARWHPIEVRYERYSFQADIPHIEYVQEQRNFRFQIQEVAGSLGKDDRIERLIPLFANKKIWMPDAIWYTETESGKIVNALEKWITEEYLVFPNAMEKDGLDAMSRMCEKDMHLPWPRPRDYANPKDAWLTSLRADQNKKKKSWMSA